MKKADFIILSAVFGVLLLLFACRKDIDFMLQGKEAPPSAVLETAKVWHLKHLDKGIRRHLTPRWDGSWTEQSSSGERLLVVPAREKRVNNKDIKIRRVFIFNASGGVVSDGRIVEFLGVKYDVDENLRFLVRNYDRSAIADFDGGIMQYDVNYRQLENVTYKGGRKVESATTEVITRTGAEVEIMTSQGPHKVMSMNMSAVTCEPVYPEMVGFPPVQSNCIYNVFITKTYDLATDCLIRIEYLYISHWCESDEGEGSGSGSGSGTGSDNGEPPYGGDDDEGDNEINAPTSSQVREQLEEKPFALFDDPCAVLIQWLNVAKHQVAQAEINKLLSIIDVSTIPVGQPHFTIIDVGHVQDIDDAHSSVVNMDFFPIHVQQLPVINGQQVTPGQLLGYIRKNINNFVDSTKANFVPYQWNGINDHQLWNSNNPIGAVVAIDLEGPDDGSVIVSGYNNDKWTFTTIHEPHYGSHPVSGNRDFGYTINSDGSYTFYTRGVDRLTNVSGTSLYNFAQFFGSEMPLSLSDNLWRSFQDRVAEFTNANGGSATIQNEIVNRPDWIDVKMVLAGIAPLSTLNKDCPD